MAVELQCPRTLALQFPSEIYRSTGASQVLPELVKSLDLPNVRGIQFMQNGVVRVTYKEPAQCDAALTGGVRFRGAALRASPVDSRTRLVYVRDLPVEVPVDGLKVYLRAFGVIHSVSMQTYPGMPQVFTGTRVVKVTLTKDLPSSARVSGFDVRFWYQGQPQACPVCRSYGHRVKDCPFNGLCRRCSQPGHMARECSFRRSSVVPAASSVPDVSDPVAGADPSISEDEDDPDYVLSSASESGPCSGDEEVLRSVPTSVLAARARKRSAPPPVPSDESSVDLRDNELSPESDPVSGTPESASAVVPSDPVPVPDPVPGMPESASAVVVPDPATVPVPVPGTPVSASAVVVPDVKTSVSKPRKKKPRSSKSAAASSPAKSSSVPVTSTPVAESTSVAESPPPTYWEATRDTGRGYVVKDCTGAQVYFDFGRLTRSIEIESTTFEYDRFVKYVHHNVDRPYLCDYVKASTRAPRTTGLLPGTPLEFPEPSK